MTEQNGAKWSATEELRRMLDELGVKWNPLDGEDICFTEWYTHRGAFVYTARESYRSYGDHMLRVETCGIPKACLIATPEQAIAATLGRGECKADKLCDGYLYYTSYWCKGCGERFAYRPISGKDRGASPKFCPNCGSRIEVVSE